MAYLKMYFTARKAKPLSLLIIRLISIIYIGISTAFCYDSEPESTSLLGTCKVWWEQQVPS